VCAVPLAGFGPIDPANGFPTYYQDSTALALAPCLDVVCNPALGLPNPALPLSFPDNFPVEVFYSRAIAKMTVGTVSALYTAAVEGTFLNGAVALAGDQIVFSRVRVRVAGLQPGGLYTVTHPYGVTTFTADGFGVINDTVTIGAVPLQFQLALAGPVGPFLRFATGLVPPPPGTIGNPAADQTVTGSACGQNFFRVAGPGLPLGAIQTTLFSTVIGKIAQTCGNGVLDLGEQCDDGNTLNGDCCSATCRFEAAGSACPSTNPLPAPRRTCARPAPASAGRRSTATTATRVRPTRATRRSAARTRPFPSAPARPRPAPPRERTAARSSTAAGARSPAAPALHRRPAAAGASRTCAVFRRSA